MEKIRRNPLAAAVAGAALAIVIIVVVVVLVAGGGEATANEVRFQTASDRGPEPFTAPADVPKGTSSSTSSVASVRQQEREPGTFGGTVCDRERLIRELTTDLQKVSVWAKVAGVEDDPQVVVDYIRTLRPATLTRDTQVTNHSYSGGSAVPYQAILQKGTAVLVDEDGAPAARCRDGSPLTKPAKLAKETKCVNCPRGYRPPPPCDAKCARRVNGAPRVKKIGTRWEAGTVPTTARIQAAKRVLEICREERDGLERCKIEYERARALCTANPLNKLCDSTICFDASTDISLTGCASYISRKALGLCLRYADVDEKNACFKRGKDLQKKCAAQPRLPECTVDPKIKAFRLRRQCAKNHDRPECPALQIACRDADLLKKGCAELRNLCVHESTRTDCKAVEQFDQICAKTPNAPECQVLQQSPENLVQGDDPAIDQPPAEEDPPTGEPGTEEPPVAEPDPPPITVPDEGP